MRLNRQMYALVSKDGEVCAFEDTREKAADMNPGHLDILPVWVVPSTGFAPVSRYMARLLGSLLDATKSDLRKLATIMRPNAPLSSTSAQYIQYIVRDVIDTGEEVYPFTDDVVPFKRKQLREALHQANFTSGHWFSHGV